MNDPRRLRETGCTDLERALLETGSTYHDSTQARVKTLAALGLAGTAALSVGAASASTPWLLRLGLSKLQVVISMASAATALSVGVFVWEQHRVAQNAAPAVVQSVAPAKLGMLAPPAAAPEPAAAPSEPAVDSASLAATDGAARARKNEHKEGAPLAAELEALDAARAALSRGDAGGALSRLDAYARAYPAGRLVLEAEVLRIDALARSGQTAQARQRAESFLRRYPKSVLAPRVRSYVGSAG